MATVELTTADRLGLEVAASIVEDLPICEHLPRNRHRMKHARLTILAEHLRELATRRARGDGEVGDRE